MIVKEKTPVLITVFMLLLIFNSGGNKTKRGSRQYQQIGSYSLYHGNIPLQYANNNLLIERSPPIASRPSLSEYSAGGKNNSSLRIYMQR